MSPTCSKNDRIVVLNRLVLSLFPDSIRLSSNIGFSYQTVREFRHRPRPLCSRSMMLLGPFSSATIPPRQVQILRRANLNLNFFLRLRRVVARPQRHRNRCLAAPTAPFLIGHQNGGGNRDRGISPDQDTDDHCEAEIMQHLAAKKEQS